MAPGMQAGKTPVNESGGPPRKTSQPKHIPDIHKGRRTPQITEITHQSLRLLIQALERSRRGPTERHYNPMSKKARPAIPPSLSRPLPR